jgi:hypothetical protein
MPKRRVRDGIHDIQQTVPAPVDLFAIEVVEIFQHDLRHVDGMELIDNQLNYPIMQLRGALHPNEGSFRESVGELFIGIPSHRGNHPRSVLQLKQQVRIALTIGPHLPIRNAKDLVDLRLGLNIADEKTGHGSQVLFFWGNTSPFRDQLLALE